jgi:dTDP-4-dehydrorhamnose reductase
VDLVAPRALEALLDELGPRTIVLSAALSRIADCEADPALAEATNAALPERAARWAAANGARLALVSTDLVFGGAPPVGERFAEDDPPAPLHRYGRTKAEGEERALLADPRALVVRLPLLFGDSRGRGQGATDAVLAAVARGERPRLFEDEWRTPLDVDDAAAATLEAAGTALTGRLHLAGPRRLSRFALGREALLARDGGVDPEMVLEPSTRAEAGMAESRAADVSLDASRAVRYLRTPLRPPEAALRGTVT